MSQGTSFKPKLGHWAAASFAAALVLGGSTAKAGGDLQLGEQVFQNNCAACHMGGGNTVLPDHTLKKAAIEKFLDGGLNITAIIYQEIGVPRKVCPNLCFQSQHPYVLSIENPVQHGKNAMPAWEDQLDEDEIQAVAEYVYDQSTNEKW